MVVIFKILKIHIVYIILFVGISSVSAFPTMKEVSGVIHDANNLKTHDNIGMTHLYKQCNSLKESKDLYLLLNMSLFSESNRLLNLIAFSNKMLKFGLIDEAFNKISPHISSILKQNDFVLSDYYAFLGEIALKSENPELSISNYKQALFFSQKTKNKFLIQKKIINIGTSYTALGRIDSGMLYFNMAKKMICEETKENTLFLDLNIAVNKMNGGDYAGARDIYFRSLPFLKKEQNNEAVVRTLSNIANTYLLEKKYDHALQYYEDALEKSINGSLMIDQIRIYTELSTLFIEKQDFKRGLIYRILSDSIRDKNDIMNISQSIVENEKLNEVNIQKVKNQMKDEVIKREQFIRYSVSFFLIVLLVILSVTIYQYHLLSKKNKVLLGQRIKDTRKMLHQKQEVKSGQNIHADLLKQINELVLADEFYKDANISLDVISKQLNTNRSYLSEVINKEFDMNFNRWLNEIRINKACQLLLNTTFDKYSLEGIGSMVGYSSVSTFNVNFKKITGITPSYFRENRES